MCRNATESCTRRSLKLFLGSVKIKSNKTLSIEMNNNEYMYDENKTL